MSGEGAGLMEPRRGLGNRFRRGTIICPVCGHDGRIHGRDPVTPMVTSLWIQCSNLTCGMTWKMQLAFEYVTSPSAIDKPELELPQAPANFPRHTYPLGPPGRNPAPDPDQFVMFDDGEGDGGEAGEATAASA